MCLGDDAGAIVVNVNVRGVDGVQEVCGDLAHDDGDVGVHDTMS